MALFMLCVVAGGLMASCEQVSCPLNNTVESIYGFYASARTADGVFAEGAQVTILDTLTVSALGRDTILANRLYNKNSIGLPVSYYGETDSLLFTFTDKQGLMGRDTLWIHKQSHPHFDDPSCPVHVWHVITGVESTHHLIDTILIHHAEINYDGLENLQIYFYTSDNEEETTE
ncbi:MAG: hypothetical protein J6Y05_07280 [Bacteroidales bacterium]|nr:hypothetical protein [Bacteroidales bacterium]